MISIGDLRTITYAAPGTGLPQAGGVRDGAVHDMCAVLGGAAPRTALDALERWDEVRASLAAARFGAPVGPMGQVRLLAPILYPRALFCAGANYIDHVAEMARVLGLPDEGGRKDGDKPWHFVATPSHSVVGPDAAVSPSPPIRASSTGRRKSASSWAAPRATLRPARRWRMSPA